MRKQRTVFLLVGVLVLALAFAPGGTAAREIRQGDQCVIPADETIAGNLFVLCRTLTIDGVVNGDVLGAATSVTINGTVNGDVYLLAGTLTINGTLGEDLHFVGPVLQVESEARFADDRADLIAAAVSTTVAQGVAIPGSVVGVGYQLLLDGEVGDEVRFWGETLRINGQVVGDVDASVGDSQSANVPQVSAFIIQTLLNVDLTTPGFYLNEGGQVDGNLHYASPHGGDVLGRVTGETVYTPVVAQPDLTQIIPEEDASVPGLGTYLSQTLREFLILGVIGLALLRFIPGFVQLPAVQVGVNLPVNAVVGLGAILVGILVALAVLILAVALIFLLAALQLVDVAVGAATILGVGYLGATSTFYLIVLFFARVVAALFVGRLIVRVTVGDDGSMRVTTISLVVGILLLAALAALPAVGWVFNWGAVLLGMGAVVRAVYQAYLHRRDAILAPPPPRMEPPPLPRYPEEARHYPPPIIGSSPRPPGMENLPPGFVWWDDKD
ncbi:MAG: hypothetical protein H6672_17370 [Anaerolineaceae bacterium]|nr:hypothetical protein [Anaerolineaceae bacterium]